MLIVVKVAILKISLGDFNHLRLKPSSGGNIFDIVLPCFPRNTSPKKEGSLIRIDEHESSKFRQSNIYS